MNINRTNYEEYFLLYTDNELSAAERRAVEEFIKRNPDVGKELTMLQQSTLRPEKDIVFRNKEALMQFQEDVIREDNYEEFFLLYADNELTNLQKAKVEEFVYNHPQYQSAFELLQEIRLTPDNGVVYPNKERLYRHEQGERVRIGWWKVAAAAIVLLFAGILWVNNRPGVLPTTEVAKGGNKKQSPAGQIILPADTKVIPSNDKPDIKTDTTSTLAQQPGLKVAEKPGQEAINPRKELAANTRKETKSPGLAQPERKDKIAVTAKKISGSDEGRTNDSEGPGLPAVEADPSLANNTRKPIVDEAASKPDEARNVNTEDVTYASNENTENVYVANIPIDNKHSLRGLFRKASRLINKNSSLKQKQGILIGNIEIAFQ